MHAFQVRGNNIDYLFNLDAVAAKIDPVSRLGLAEPAGDTLIYRAFPLAWGYLLMAAVFLAFAASAARRSQPDSAGH